MARCNRCNSCECMWSFDPCKRCGFPHADTRTTTQIEEDIKSFVEYLVEYLREAREGGE